MAWIDRLVGWTKKPKASDEKTPKPTVSKKAPAREPTPTKPAPPKARKPAAPKAAKSASGKPTSVKKAPARRDSASDSQKLLVRGKQRHQKGDVKSALAHYSKAIELDPNNAEAYANRGVAREATGDVEGAKSDYTKSIQIQVNNEINRQLDAQ